MTPRRPFLHVDGMVAFHDQSCAVISNESAVFNLQRGVFEPSWKAQEKGWRLVRAKNKFQALILDLIF